MKYNVVGLFLNYVQYDVAKLQSFSTRYIVEWRSTSEFIMVLVDRLVLYTISFHTGSASNRSDNVVFVCVTIEMAPLEQHNIV